MTSIKTYGIKNCSTMKKAMAWLEEHTIDFEFHDYKKSGINEELLRTWLSQVPWDQLINKRGTTWRKLSEEDKLDIDNDKAMRLMVSSPSLIKRPVLITNNQVHLGFKAEQYQKIFA